MTCSFKFVVSAFGSTVTKEEQLKIINSFSYLGFQGVIDMKNADAQFHVLADYGLEHGTEREAPIHIYMGKLVNTILNSCINRAHCIDLKMD